MSHPLPVVAVVGLARCGSTMIMHQLEALGVPMCPGTYPDSGELPVDLLHAHIDGEPIAPGHSIKLLDIAATGLPPTPPGGWVIVYGDRNPTEQALSSLKFMAAIGTIPVEEATGHALYRYERSLAADRPAALGMARAAGPTHVQRFEDAIGQPVKRAKQLARFLTANRIPIDPDLIGAAAALVHDRSPLCADDLACEADLIRLDSTP